MLNNKAMENFEITKKEVNEILDKAEKIVLEEVRNRARIVLQENDELDEFIMAMGTFFFTNKPDGSIGDFKDEEVSAYISEFDKQLKITGNPMRFTADGEIVTHW